MTRRKPYDPCHACGGRGKIYKGLTLATFPTFVDCDACRPVRRYGKASGNSAGDGSPDQPTLMGAAAVN